jgi:hypothetical protein
MYFVKPARRGFETTIATPLPGVEPLAPSPLPVALISCHDFHVSRNKYMFRESSFTEVAEKHRLNYSVFYTVLYPTTHH